MGVEWLPRPSVFLQQHLSCLVAIDQCLHRVQHQLGQESGAGYLPERSLLWVLRLLLWVLLSVCAGLSKFNNDVLLAQTASPLEAVLWHCYHTGHCALAQVTWSNTEFTYTVDRDFSCLKDLTSECETCYSWQAMTARCPMAVTRLLYCGACACAVRTAGPVVNVTQYVSNIPGLPSC